MTEPRQFPDVVRVNTDPQASGRAGQLQELRAGIDEVDALLVELLCQRGRLVQFIQHLKGDRGRVPVREAEILGRVQSASTGPYPAETLCRVWEALFDAAPSLPPGDLHG